MNINDGPGMTDQVGEGSPPQDVTGEAVTQFWYLMSGPERPVQATFYPAARLFVKTFFFKWPALKLGPKAENLFT